METTLFTTREHSKVQHHRLTQSQKEANDFAWYKDKLDFYDAGAFSTTSVFGGVSDQRRMQSNYDLFNNIIDPVEFEYICKPYGDAVGEMPADFTNRDITSGKIKVLLGMESKRPFSWRILATNEDATTRKEEEEFGRIKEYVIAETMQPIINEIRLKYEEQQKGQKLTPEQQQEIQQQVQQEIQAATPDKVRKYMQREHQDPAEALGHQILMYLYQNLNIKDKFNDGWKHALLSGLEVFWEGEKNGEPDFEVINSMRFDYDKSPDVKYIEDGEWAAYYADMTPSQVISMFADDLTDDEIDKIYEHGTEGNGRGMVDQTFTFSDRDYYTANTIRVFHLNFKSLRKIGFLDYLDPETGEVESMLVNEKYKLKKEIGDIKLEWKWIPETHEGYKIGTDIYKKMRPVIGQHNDLDNLYKCKLSYKGAAYDNMNSQITSLMDRMKPYQFYYNIIMYRIEMLMASDKGKILLMNLNMIPKSQGIDIKKFFYYADATKVTFANPNEEGNRGGSTDVTNAAKEIDMSLASDIQKYIMLAEYIEKRSGDSVGITKAMEGQTEAREAVQNNQLNYTQSSYIIEPYFELHGQVKKNSLQSLIDTAIAIYSDPKYDGKKLPYVLDDLSTAMLTIDSSLLDMSTLGLFVENSTKAWEAKELVQNLSQAAMQNQKAELSDVVKIVRSESVQEAEELLTVAEEKAHERQKELNMMSEKLKNEAAERERAFQREEWDHDKEMIIVKEQERRKTEIQKQAILSIGFNENKDMDDDGKLDVLEVANDGVDANIKMRNQILEENKFVEEQRKNKVEEQQNEKKLKIEAKKATAKKAVS